MLRIKTKGILSVPVNIYNSPTSQYLRIIVNNIFLVIYYSLYRAMLGASLAIEIEREGPVTSLEGVLNSNYKLQVSKGSSVEAYFRDAPNSSVPKRLIVANKLLAKQINERDLLRKVKNGSLEHYILPFEVFQALHYLPEWSCGISSVKVDYRPITNGLIFRKNWPFTELINHHLLILKERGHLEEIRKRYLGHSELDCNTRTVEPATITTTFSLYILMITGLLSSFISFLFELSTNYLKSWDIPTNTVNEG